MTPINITLWGTRRTGKTTYLMMLYHTFQKQHDKWIIHIDNAETGSEAEAAREFLKANRRRFLSDRTFPERTRAPSFYTYTITRLDENRQPLYQVKLRFGDIAGEIYEYLYDRQELESNAARMKPQAWFDKLVNAQGIIMLLDPAWEDDPEHNFYYRDLLTDFIERLQQRHLEQTDNTGGAIQDVRLHDTYIALCLSKSDASDEHWRRALSDWSCSRVDPEATVDCADHCPIYRMMGAQFMQGVLNGIVPGDQVKCFLVSSVGRTEQTDEANINLASDQLWKRRTTPLPRRLEPSSTDTDTARAYQSLADDLKGLDEKLKEAAQQYRGQQNDNAVYFPVAVGDIDKLNPTNIIEPVQWLVDRLRADK